MFRHNSHMCASRGIFCPPLHAYASLAHWYTVDCWHDDKSLSMLLYVCRVPRRAHCDQQALHHRRQLWCNKHRLLHRQCMCSQCLRRCQRLCKVNTLRPVYCTSCDGSPPYVFLSCCCFLLWKEYFQGGSHPCSLLGRVQDKPMYSTRIVCWLL